MLRDSGGQTPTLADRLASVARPAIDEYAKLPTFRGAMITGSVARGQCDRHSDVDCSIYLTEPPDDELMDRECERAKESGGGVYSKHPGMGFAIYRMIDGVKVDFGIGPSSEVDGVLNAVLEEHDTNTIFQLIIDGIRRCRPVYGHDLIAEWIRRTDEYPEALAEKMVTEHLAIPAPWIMKGMAAARGDYIMLKEEVLRMQKCVMGILYGLNREWHPGKLKGYDHRDALAIAPPDLGARLRKCWSEDLIAAADEASAILEETVSLVEQHMPSVDTSKARWRLTMDHSHPLPLDPA